MPTPSAPRPEVSALNSVVFPAAAGPTIATLTGTKALFDHQVHVARHGGVRDVHVPAAGRGEDEPGSVLAAFAQQAVRGRPTVCLGTPGHLPNDAIRADGLERRIPAIALRYVDAPDDLG